MTWLLTVRVLPTVWLSNVDGHRLLRLGQVAVGAVSLHMNEDGAAANLKRHYRDVADVGGEVQVKRVHVWGFVA